MRTEKILFIIVLMAVAVTALIFLRGSEDRWICENGKWLKHGNPTSSMPKEGCGKTSEESSGSLIIKVFFNNDKMDPEFSCNKVFPVEREIPKTQTVARAALEELLKGPVDKEKTQGFFSNINPGVKIQKLTIENGVAKVDFDEQLEFQMGGSCRVAAIRAQITQTLKQFPTVSEVIISVNGRAEDILQP